MAYIFKHFFLSNLFIFYFFEISLNLNFAIFCEEEERLLHYGEKNPDLRTTVRSVLLYSLCYQSFTIAVIVKLCLLVNIVYFGFSDPVFIILNRKTQ